MRVHAFDAEGIKRVYDSDVWSDMHGLACEDESLTVQSQLEDSDINVIYSRFAVTGLAPQVIRPPLNVDFSDETFDFQKAMDAVALANASFASMPADVRVRFANDPVKFIQFCEDPANVRELIRMGLADKVPGPVPVPVPLAP